MSAVEVYAACVDAVIEQRTRLRGVQPPGDLFGSLPPNHPLLTVDARRALGPNLEIIASYVRPAPPPTSTIDVGPGRYSLPLALRYREVINVDPSPAMLAGFRASAEQGGVTNVRAVEADWLAVDPPRGTLALVNHVTYLTRDIVPFIQKLEAAASRRVLMTVNSPPPPSWNRELFRLVHDEAEAIVPGHVELMNVLWELGIEPDLRDAAQYDDAVPEPPDTRGGHSERHRTDSVATSGRSGRSARSWNSGSETCSNHDSTSCSTQTADGYAPTWLNWAREVLVTWESRD